ncbi:hypothetical protein [Novosphingobium lindaniclasticum]
MNTRLKTMIASRLHLSSSSVTLTCILRFLVATPLLLPGAAKAEDAAACRAEVEKGPVLVDATCVDPQFNKPVIDSRTTLSEPYAIYKVSGHFEGTGAKFNIYLPPKENWKGRFFQLVYPVSDGNANEETLRFGLNGGAYTVQTVSTGGYRSDAAAAKFAKTIARKYYGEKDKRIYGYVYGGSGGSYQTIGAIENTKGVWDGAVPFVIGTETSIPNNFFIRTFARLVLKAKAQRISDAMGPGGNGDPYAYLNEVEVAALKEVTALGVPLRGWDNTSYLLGLNDPRGLFGFEDMVKAADKTYADDFWSKPGYLGTEKSPLGELIRAARVRQATEIEGVTRDEKGTPTGFRLVENPSKPADPIFDATIGGADGTELALKGSIDFASGMYTLLPGNSDQALAAIVNGAKVKLDNSWPLALTTYHRHQVPSDGSFTTWNQFKNPNGSPIYPQRPLEVAKMISLGVSGGGTHSGKINGKVIVIGNLLDVDAYPWHGDWYSKRVKAALGDKYEDNFRLWYNDHADHLDGSVIASGPVDTQWVRLVNYVGIVQQAVLDVSRWVEQSVAPPPSSNYVVSEGQVSVDPAARGRHGIQPTVTLTSGGKTRVKIRAGTTINLEGRVEVPPGAGEIANVDWSQTGMDEFSAAPLTKAHQREMMVKTTMTYSTPGTYYPVLRATANREGDPSLKVRYVRNLARIRVDVE